MLPSPGDSRSRPILLVAIGGAAWLDVFGVVTRRGVPTIAGTAGRVLLGFWRAALWIYMLPVAGLLALVAAVDADRARDSSSGA